MVTVVFRLNRLCVTLDRDRRKGKKSEICRMKNLNYGQDNRELVDMNVRIAMDGEEPHLIDEWQEVPITMLGL